MAKADLSLTHVIGPKTGHKYHPAAREEINRRIDSIVGKGRVRLPRHVRFATYTLRYNESAWVRVDGLVRHWERAAVDAELTGPRSVAVKTQNVTALTLTMPAGYCPLENRPEVLIDGTRLGGDVPPVGSDRSWEVRLRKAGAGWVVAQGEDDTHRKRHGL